MAKRSRWPPTNPDTCGAKLTWIFIRGLDKDWFEQCDGQNKSANLVPA